MASFKTSARFRRFDWDRAGYAALMDSGPVQSLVKGKAGAVASSADAMLSPGGYAVGDHEAKPFTGSLARGYVVRTKTDHARRAQAREKTLTKALGSAKGA